MKKLLSLLLCAFMLAVPAGCRIPKQSYSFEAMDTYMTMDIYGEKTGKNLQPPEDVIKVLDRQLSTTNTGVDNAVYRLNREGSAIMMDELNDFVKRTLDLCEETDGALDITVYPIVREWGFISKDFKIPSKERLTELVKKVDYNQVWRGSYTVKVPEGVQVDFGAVAKGYAADKMTEHLKNAEATGAICNLGGTVVAYGKKPGGSQWRVGVADPENSATFMGYVACTDKIIATSGSYERYFEGEDGKIYSHIIDPKTGYPVDNGILSVTIISDDGLRADGLSTALFVMGREKAEEFYRAHKDFDYIMLTADKKAYLTPGAAESFTQAEGYQYQIINIK